MPYFFSPLPHNTASRQNTTGSIVFRPTEIQINGLPRNAALALGVILTCLAVYQALKD